MRPAGPGSRALPRPPQSSGAPPPSQSSCPPPSLRRRPSRSSPALPFPDLTYHPSRPVPSPSPCWAVLCTWTSLSRCRLHMGKPVLAAAGIPWAHAQRHLVSPLRPPQHILFLLSFLFSREGGRGAGARGDFAMPCRDGGEGRKGASSRLCAGDTVPAPFRLAVSDVLGRGERGTSMDMSVRVYVASLAKMLTFRVNDLCFRSAAPSSPGTPSATFGL